MVKELRRRLLLLVLLPFLLETDTVDAEIKLSEAVSTEPLEILSFKLTKC